VSVAVSVERDGAEQARTGLELCIASGGVAVFPADGLYGLACDPLNELDPIGKAEALGVGAGDFQRRAGGVGGEQLAARQLVGDRQRDRARTGADVEHPARPQLQRQLDQQLGLRPRDQYPPVDLELDVPEPLAPEDVRHRLPPQPPPHHLPKPPRRIRRHPRLRLRRKPRPLPPRRLGEQQFSIETRTLDADGRQRVHSAFQCISGIARVSCSGHTENLSR